MSNNLKYPLWNILKKTLNHEKFTVYNVNVRNKSKMYTNLEKQEKICAIVYEDRVEFKNL